MKLQEIKSILKMSKKELLNYTIEKLDLNGYKDIYATENYVYAKGEIPILLVAHCDTVHKEQPSIILFDYKQQMMWSPEGIGGDDRCGVIAIFEIIKDLKPYVLFTQDEEIGGLGAIEFCKEQKLDKIKFAIEIDRRGNNQAVFYDCGNKELQDYICNNYKFDLEYGSFTDVCVIGATYNIGIVNLSAGYYNEHQKIEFIYFPALYNTINKVKKILKDESSEYYDYQEIKYIYNYAGKFEDYYDYDIRYTYQEERDFDELTDKEWKELYGYNKPKTKKDLYKILF